MKVDFRGEMVVDAITGRFKMNVQVGSHVAADVSVEMPVRPAGGVDDPPFPTELVDAVCKALAVRLRKEVGK